MSETWWPPREIVFSREQMEWLLKHLLALDEGQWPPEPGGYNDVKTGKPEWWRGAYFETPCQFGAEVRHRLEATGSDGLLVLSYYVYDVDLEYLARLNGLDVHRLSRRIERVLRYMSGWKRKRKTYREWRQKRRGRQPEVGG